MSEKRWQEVLIPKPPDEKWATNVSAPFREYFSTIAKARSEFAATLAASGYEFIASTRAVGVAAIDEESVVEDSDGQDDDTEEGAD